MKSLVKEIDIKNDIKEFWNLINIFIRGNNEISSIYNNSFYDYQKEYCISNSSYIDEKSKIYIEEDEILCGYIFLLNKKQEKLELNFGYDFPGLVIIRENIDKNTLSKFLNEIDQIHYLSKRVKFTIPSFKSISKNYEEIFKDRIFTHKNIMSRSIDLNVEKENLWKNLRKSYKSPINKGLREQEIILLDYKNPREEIFKEIQTLHFLVAGRKTRSQKTWDLQFSAIKKDNGFAICSYQGTQLTGAVYFLKTYNHSYYSVGIFTSESKKKLYGYCLIWKAILYCKERNIKFVELDNNVSYKYPTTLDQKLVKISHFKSGFGGEIYPKHEFII